MDTFLTFLILVVIVFVGVISGFVFGQINPTIKEIPVSEKITKCIADGGEYSLAVDKNGVKYEFCEIRKKIDLTK
jgi:hypothetical protein